MKATLHLSLVAVASCLIAPLQAADNTSAASQQIDSLLAQSWQKHKITPNAPVDDATFLRRAYLTVAGRIPTYEEAKAFHA